MTGFADFIDPSALPEQSTGQVLGPTPPVPANLEGRMAGWQQVMEKLKDPAVQRGLLTMSQVTGSAPGAGESAIGQLARGANAGMAAYQTSLWDDSQRELLQQKEQRAQNESDSTLATQEQARTNSRLQMDETKQRMENNAALQPLNLKKIRAEVARAELLQDDAERNAALQKLKASFLQAYLASPVPDKDLNAIELGWISEAKGPTTLEELRRAQIANYNEPNHLPGGTTGAALAQAQLDRVAAALEAEDPEISKISDPARRKNLALLKAVGFATSGGKKLGETDTRGQTAEAEFKNLQAEYEALPEEKKKKQTLQQYVATVTTGIERGETYQKDPALAVAIREMAREAGTKAVPTPAPAKSGPAYDVWIKAAKQANPNTSEADLKKYYEGKYGAAK